MEDLGDCDLVVEAVFEDMDVKKQVLPQDPKSTCRPGCSA